MREGEGERERERELTERKETGIERTERERKDSERKKYCIERETERERLGDDVPAEGAVAPQQGRDAAAVAQLHEQAQPPLPPLRLPVSDVIYIYII